MPPKKRQTPHIDANSSFTPENFEKELKNLAARAKTDASAHASDQLAVYARVALLLVLAAASANASRAALSPVYGAIPAAVWHAAVVGTACFVGWAANLHFRRLLPARRPLVLWLPALAALVPGVQSALERASPLLTARWGPLVTEALTLGPLLAGTAACVANELERADGLDELAVRLPRWLADALPGLGAWSVFKFVERLGSHTGTGATDSTAWLLVWLRTRVVRQLALAAAYAAAAPSRVLWYALPAVLHAALLNVHVAQSPWALELLNRQLRYRREDGGGTWAVLDRRESLTGYLAVLENQERHLRVLRCDHSLLGGEWLQFPANPVAEPIYGVFIMLEAVRLIDAPHRPVDADAKALVVGLGIGTAPAALVAHGIDTTVVEIDPAVHAFAQQYFHLPANHTAVIEDAVGYTARLAADADGPRFDYIVHDVFTGGAEPIPLFTLEFLQTLHALLKPTGVIAINYAGDLGAIPIKAVVHTIRSVFPACRVFREHPRDPDSDDDFANVVIFCTANGAPVAFRPPQAADLLNSATRRHFLVPVHEVVDADLRAPEDARLVRINDTAQLAAWHTEGALGHWTVMRTVLPAAVWELW